MTDMRELLKRLDAMDARPEALALRERGYERLRLETGDSVVDVGCGSGRAAHELAERGADSHGIDPSQVMIDAARSRWSNVEFRVAAAERLPFGDGELAGYRVDKVLHAVDDPSAAIVEARRVLRPGGRAVLIGQDWDLLAIDADDHDMTRRVVRARAAAMPSPNVARGYGNLLRDNGFTGVTVEVHTVFPPVEAIVGSLGQTADEVPGASRWLDEQRERAASGRMFVAMPVFLAAGTR
ncbi:MAG TPA: methyltransferase domain-containing protein [Stackebrandtia sp.]|jgi:SAM-dependent methyltransferase|uniref:methyltransferase domain-containing protein n=1 Tax=Stackebrandtia sp. TaxID=2023065 RepID=UPI002D2FB75E|nr:methyltransferase domain-containing protein [Stackebrandtia sp.]HZE40650.1 methyltransferase domain-containing protein [Stackebrandtia sp.]